jgi:hypothetical protein
MIVGLGVVATSPFTGGEYPISQPGCDNLYGCPPLPKPSTAPVRPTVITKPPIPKPPAPRPPVVVVRPPAPVPAPTPVLTLAPVLTPSRRECPAAYPFAFIDDRNQLLCRAPGGREMRPGEYSEHVGFPYSTTGGQAIEAMSAGDGSGDTVLRMPAPLAPSPAQYEGSIDGAPAGETWIAGVSNTVVLIGGAIVGAMVLAMTMGGKR